MTTDMIFSHETPNYQCYKSAVPSETGVVRVLYIPRNNFRQSAPLKIQVIFTTQQTVPLSPTREDLARQLREVTRQNAMLQQASDALLQTIQRAKEALR